MSRRSKKRRTTICSEHPKITPTTNEYSVFAPMEAWVLGEPDELSLVEKPVPHPG